MEEMEETENVAGLVESMETTGKRDGVALSKLLRHAAEEAGLKLDAEGFASVEQVMQWPRLRSLQVTFADIQAVVSDNAKQRFSLKRSKPSSSSSSSSSADPADWLIRANQGHSIAAVASAALLTPITLAAGNVPDVVVHGTYFASYALIVASGGLKRMGRNHIHFSTGLPSGGDGAAGAGAAVVSGMRSDAELLIYVDIKRSLQDGAVLWWMSENGVVLTEGDAEGVLRMEYWTKVEGRKMGVGVLWEEGKQVAELPEEVKARRAPAGKGPRGRGRGRGSGNGERGGTVSKRGSGRSGRGSGGGGGGGGGGGEEETVGEVSTHEP
ncbi:uncharacterized protein L3040_007257 [Drepanopeziza brunnea f. sp. 'multigermtubi']|uniref:uncharacterized protein n=1 Tax=Drepanopeziza brunnea f. sp. 'multigermtubi' TaxID=698441 RepID=UPI00239AAF11|nr:hypothetical protein L3040_007257 [Drepanopeziza brunnea f. sp. 'multigermtubi']